MELVFLFGLMAFFFALGVPIGIALIFPCFILLLVDPVTSASFLSQNFYTGVASSTMIAIPFFMICGNIMDRGGHNPCLHVFRRGSGHPGRRAAHGCELSVLQKARDQRRK